MSQTVFFDLDGTLTDPFVGITGSIRYALEKLDLDVPEANELAWCIGPPLLENFRTLVGHDQAPAAVAHYRDRFSRVGLYENTPYPGIHDLLSTLRGANIELCVASSKPLVFVRKILEHFELIEYFGAVFGSELDGTRNDKSELLHFALSQTGVAAKEATMIGDRKHDIVGALDNGISAIGVLYGYGSVDELTSAGAHRLANTPNELAALLL
jgi:phosphoglycolate phosphatase